MSGRRLEASIRSLQRRPKRVEQLAGAMLACRRRADAVEEGPLLRQDKSHTLALRDEFDRRKRHLYPGFAEQQLIAVDDTPVRHDVLIDGLEEMHLSITRATGVHLLAADAEVHLMPARHRIVGIENQRFLATGSLGAK